MPYLTPCEVDFSRPDKKTTGKRKFSRRALARKVDLKGQEAIALGSSPKELCPPPNKKRSAADEAKEEIKLAPALQLLPEKFWVDKIFPYLGPGHFAFVAGVCSSFREYYLGYFSTIEEDDLPAVRMTDGRERDPVATDTIYTVAFSSIACAKYCLMDDKKNKSVWRTTERYVCISAARGGYLDVLKWARNQNPPYSWSREACSSAASNGHFETLKWMRAQDPPCEWDDDTCSFAAQNGHLEIIQWARRQDPPCPWHSFTCELSARYGHFEVLKWLRSQDPPCPWDYYVCTYAARNGHFDILRWARSQDPPCEWDNHPIKFAVEHARLDFLQWAHEENPKDFPCDSWTCVRAAEYGQLEILQWLRSLDPPCFWNFQTILSAVKHDHWDVARWAYANGCPCPKLKRKYYKLLSGHE